MARSLDDETILKALEGLERRVAALETRLDLQPEDGSLPNAEGVQRTLEEDEDAIEQQIGQNWFAQLGIVILAIGIAFLLTFPYSGLPAVLPSIAGYLLAGAVVVLSFRWRESYSHISGYLLGGGIALSFFATLRLSFFSAQPALDDRILLALLLLGSAALGLYLAGRTTSRALVILSLLLGYAGSLCSDSPLFIFSAVTALSVISVIYALRREWPWMFTLSAGCNVLVHLLWFLNNPVLGHGVGMVASPSVNVYFVLLYAIIIALGALGRKDPSGESASAAIRALANGGGAYVLFLLLTVTKFHDELPVSQLLASGVFLTIAILFWIRKRSLYSTFVYAMLGYTALSVAIIAWFGTPDRFIWLSLESILVISTAVWFRSRFIVVANFVIYLLLFLAFLLVAKEISVISICFGLVALLSARILNSQRDRLELKTEYMRNAYLGTAFFMIPYALHHTVPSGFVSLSWLVVALFYHLMSKRLNNNRKYRWMALLTLVITIPYALLVDLTRLDPTLRIVSFIVLGTVLLVVSVGYSKRRARPDSPPAPPEGPQTP
jgi:hypothetical protein